ncbi:MAG: hypothetical protein A3D39_04560 [Candidatus Buchananbacteria bacterium RIFCSPHIGHO2_02_FULL_39_17]|nr:MAG: hypothetical protein A3D39_04560 [Candidatus Buchananbacteria bacterium RIFCSPHIGHO2_02_FULL_39_17]
MPYKPRILVAGFMPENSAQDRCLQIALYVGETHMDYLLAAERKCGLSIIEAAFGEFKEIETIENKKGEKIDNRPALLNSLIEKKLK